MVTGAPLRAHDAEGPSRKEVALRQNRRGGREAAGCPSFPVCLWTSCMRCVVWCSKRAALTFSVTQIFSLLHPRDLLRVSWATKAFRAVLNDRSSKPIWRTSLASVDELPPCPRDLPEPAYAALLFSPYCFVRNGLLAILACADGLKLYRGV